MQADHRQIHERGHGVRKFGFADAGRAFHENWLLKIASDEDRSGDRFRADIAKFGKTIGDRVNISQLGRVLFKHENVRATSG